ncbi:hypothetical protein ASD82_07435 [Rhodanobacter sp. Root179]|nr:hypothetical protein ASD82_07435 [Rhodanobacter sp. Root179]
MGKLMLVVEDSAYRPSSWVIPLSSFFAASLFIEDDVFCFLEEEAWCAAVSARGVTMAVALATLPLNRVLAGAGDTCFAAATGAGFATVFSAGLVAFGAGLVTGFGTGLAAGFATTAGLATTLAGLAVLRALPAAGLPLFATALPATGFFATTLAGGAFFTAAFFAAPFVVTFFDAGALTGADFFAGDFFAGDLLVSDLATGLPTAFFDATFFAAGLLAGLAAAFGLVLATAFDAALAGVLLAFFTVAPLPATVDLPALLPDEALAFCALAAVELRVVFAISLHR